jgi:hypothetical protein
MKSSSCWGTAAILCIAPRPERPLPRLVKRVRRKNMCGACFAGGIGQQAIPRQAGSFLQAGLRLAAGPAQNAMRDIEPVRETRDSGCLCRAFLPQPVIDRNGDKLRFGLE